jgi:hypothetical protein
MTADNVQAGNNAHQIPLKSRLAKVKENHNVQFKKIRTRSKVMKIITNGIRAGNSLNGVRGPRRILKSMLSFLSEGKIAAVVRGFDERFTFTDYALDLEFKDKGQLIKFLQKSRELFPDTIVEVASAFESGDHAIAEWKLTPKQRVPYTSMGPQLPISLRGVSIVRIKGEKIMSWSDYYDPLQSRRRGLAAQFTDWSRAFRAFEE